MAAGDLLPTSGEQYAIEVRGFLAADAGFGGADWYVKNVDSFGDEIVEDQDTGLDLTDGVVAATDTLGAVPLIFTLACGTGSASTAELAYLDVKAAFTKGTDEELHMYVPGVGHVYFVGRCRGSSPKRVFMAGGVMWAQVTFLATDPTMNVVTP